MYKYKLLGLILLSLIHFNAFACDPGAGTGQCGYYENGTYYNRPRGYYSDGVSNSPTVRTIRLPSRYGAVAESSNNHNLTSSYAQSSKRKARKEALAQCKQAGGTDCKILYTIRNGCLSIAGGKHSSGLFTTSAGSTDYEGGADRAALQECHRDGLTECRIIMTEECSLPGFH